VATTALDTAVLATQREALRKKSKSQPQSEIVRLIGTPPRGKGVVVLTRGDFRILEERLFSHSKIGRGTAVEMRRQRERALAKRGIQTAYVRLVLRPEEIDAAWEALKAARLSPPQRARLNDKLQKAKVQATRKYVGPADSSWSRGRRGRIRFVTGRET
jgi:hypothetical protein